MAYPKMKPCPYCNKAEHLDLYTYEHGARRVECTMACGYMGPASTSLRFAIKNHNAEHDAISTQYQTALKSQATLKALGADHDAPG